RQLFGATRSLAEPEWDRRRRAAGVHHPNRSRLDAADSPRGRAEQEDVSGHTFDGPVLVHGPYERVVRLRHHPVVAELGYGPPGGERGHPSAAPPPKTRVHTVVVQVGRPTASAGTDPFRDQFDHLVEVLPRELRERGCPPDEFEQKVLRPFFGCAFGHDLLSQDVQRREGWVDRIQSPGPKAAEQRRALHELVPGGWEQDSGRSPAPS